MQVYKLKATVFRFSNNIEDFFKGICSNTLDRPKNAFLDVKGKIVATVDQHLLPSDEILMVVASFAADRLMQHLEKFLMLSDTECTKTALATYFDVDAAHKPQQAEYAIRQQAGQLVLTDKELPAELSEEAFTQFRLQHNIPLHGVDYDDEMLLNVSTEGHVSFDKGCFVGQEIVARVHYKSKPPRKLVVAKASELDETLKQQMTSTSMNSDSGEKIGFVFRSNK